MNDVLDKNISYLNIDNKIIKKLNDNNIFSIKELWINNKKNLKKLGLSDSEIKNIIIKLELIGYDLNKKINK